MGAAAWADAKRILAVRLDTIGDVLMTTPAIRALKHSVEGRSVTLLTSTPGAAVAHLVPEIDEALVHDPLWMKYTPQRPDSAEEHAIVGQMRERRFDAAVIFTVYSQNPLPAALLCLMADIPLRLAHCRENPYQLLSDWVHEPEPENGIRHEVRRQLDLVAEVGAVTADDTLSLQVPRIAIRRAMKALEKAGVDLERPWLVVHPGATAPSRRYPPERFAVVARHLSRIEGFQVVFTGTESERALVQKIRAATGTTTYSLAGALTLTDFAALILQAPVLVSNNSGPVHIAAAVGTPVVDLYALTNPQHTPWEVPHRVLFHDVPCAYCYKSECPQGHHQCLKLVEPDEVVDAVHALMRRSVRRIGRVAL
jgi:lipopolysaccharide heptosyltransferase II